MKWPLLHGKARFFLPSAYSICELVKRVINCLIGTPLWDDKKVYNCYNLIVFVKYWIGSFDEWLHLLESLHEWGRNESCYAKKLINFYSLVNIACCNSSHEDYPLEGNKTIKWGVEFLEKFLGANPKNVGNPIISL